jgi:hypothetical protein
MFPTTPRLDAINSRQEILVGFVSELESPERKVSATLGFGRASYGPAARIADAIPAGISRPATISLNVRQFFLEQQSSALGHPATPSLNTFHGRSGYSFPSSMAKELR